MAYRDTSVATANDELVRLANEGKRVPELEAENERLRAALEAVAGFGSVNLAGEWQHSLCDIIRSMTDCARNALNSAEQLAGDASK